jgi:hypothetical protein
VKDEKMIVYALCSVDGYDDAGDVLSLHKTKESAELRRQYYTMPSRLTIEEMEVAD